MNFIKTAIEPTEKKEDIYYFLFAQGDILLKENSSGFAAIPFLKQAEAERLDLESVCFLGIYNGHACCCARISKEKNLNGYQFVPFRGYYVQSEEEERNVLGYVRQIYHWNLQFKFCGSCGQEMEKIPDEHTRKCPTCQLMKYPRISPAIIVAVIKGDEILLARGKNFPDKKMFSVIAGFVEPGETLEECVQREVLEEVGILVNNIRYFKSQSWPFPDSLMIGFTAEHQSGEIDIDDKEIVEAGWFKAGQMPKVPQRSSVSRDLIEWFIQK